MKKIKIGDYVESYCGLKGQVVAIDDKYVYVPTSKDSILRHLSNKVGFPIINIKIHKPFKCFEVRWFDENDNVYTKEFATCKEALKYYHQHENDEEKYGWLVTKRNLNWEIVEDIIY